MALLHACLYVSKSESFVIPGLCMSKLYATTMLVIFNNRIKISGGRFGEDEDDEECEFTSSTHRLSRDPPPESRNDSKKKTKILVSSTRLTFQLASELPSLPRTQAPSTSVENRRSSNSSAC